MLCAVYKSSKKADTYLYVPKKADFSDVPQVLLDMFGKPIFVMLIPMHKERKIGPISTKQLAEALQDKGFYLQLPPSEDSLLVKHRRQQGLSDQPDKKF